MGRQSARKRGRIEALAWGSPKGRPGSLGSWGRLALCLLLALLPIEAGSITLKSLVKRDRDFESLNGQYEFSDFSVEIVGDSRLKDFKVIPLEDGFRLESKTPSLLAPGSLLLNFEVEAEEEDHRRRHSWRDDDDDDDDDERLVRALYLTAFGIPTHSEFDFSASAFDEEDKDELLGFVEIGQSATTSNLFAYTDLNPLREEILIRSELLSEGGIDGNSAAVEYHFGPDPDPIPEPGTMLLVALGTAGLAVSRRRHRYEPIRPAASARRNADHWLR